ncbi:hypothetical protein RCL1_001870 [Eukaryota sp. TZLM3-RCL]
MSLFSHFVFPDSNVGLCNLSLCGTISFFNVSNSLIPITYDSNFDLSLQYFTISYSYGLNILCVTSSSTVYFLKPFKDFHLNLFKVLPLPFSIDSLVLTCFTSSWFSLCCNNYLFVSEIDNSFHSSSFPLSSLPSSLQFNPVHSSFSPSLAYFLPGSSVLCIVKINKIFDGNIILSRNSIKFDCCITHFTWISSKCLVVFLRNNNSFTVFNQNNSWIKSFKLNLFDLGDYKILNVFSHYQSNLIGDFLDEDVELITTQSNTNQSIPTIIKNNSKKSVHSLIFDRNLDSTKFLPLKGSNNSSKVNAVPLKIDRSAKFPEFLTSNHFDLSYISLLCTTPDSLIIRLVVFKVQSKSHSFSSWFSKILDESLVSLDNDFPSTSFFPCVFPLIKCNSSSLLQFIVPIFKNTNYYSSVYSTLTINSTFNQSFSSSLHFLDNSYKEFVLDSVNIKLFVQSELSNSSIILLNNFHFLELEGNHHSFISIKNFGKFGSNNLIVLIYSTIVCFILVHDDVSKSIISSKLEININDQAFISKSQLGVFSDSTGVLKIFKISTENFVPVYSHEFSLNPIFSSKFQLFQQGPLSDFEIPSFLFITIFNTFKVGFIHESNEIIVIDKEINCQNFGRYNLLESSLDKVEIEKQSNLIDITGLQSLSKSFTSNFEFGISLLLLSSLYAHNGLEFSDFSTVSSLEISDLLSVTFDWSRVNSEPVFFNSEINIWTKNFVSLDQCSRLVLFLVNQSNLIDLKVISIIALFSETLQELLQSEIFIPNLGSNILDFDLLTTFGAHFWAPIKILEKSLEAKFQQSMKSNLGDASLYLLLAHGHVTTTCTLLSSLYRTKNDLIRAKFFSQNFESDEKARKSALANAFKAMSQQNYKFAAFLFLIGHDDVAACQCLLKGNDCFGLAVVCARKYNNLNLILKSKQSNLIDSVVFELLNLNFSEGFKILMEILQNSNNDFTIENLVIVLLIIILILSRKSFTNNFLVHPFLIYELKISNYLKFDQLFYYLLNVSIFFFSKIPVQNFIQSVPIIQDPFSFDSSSFSSDPFEFSMSGFGEFSETQSLSANHSKSDPGVFQISTEVFNLFKNNLLTLLDLFPCGLASTSISLISKICDDEAFAGMTWRNATVPCNSSSPHSYPICFKPTNSKFLLDSFVFNCREPLLITLDPTPGLEFSKISIQNSLIFLASNRGVAVLNNNSLQIYETNSFCKCLQHHPKVSLFVSGHEKSTIKLWSFDPLLRSRPFCIDSISVFDQGSVFLIKMFDGGNMLGFGCATSQDVNILGFLSFSFDFDGNILGFSRDSLQVFSHHNSIKDFCFFHSPSRILLASNSLLHLVPFSSKLSEIVHSPVTNQILRVLTLFDCFCVVFFADCSIALVNTESGVVEQCVQLTKCHVIVSTFIYHSVLIIVTENSIEYLTLKTFKLFHSVPLQEFVVDSCLDLDSGCLYVLCKDQVCVYMLKEISYL